MKIGTPYTKTATRVMLLGSGELGKEIAIELIRLGVEVHACDGYSNAPAQQVAQFSHEFDMLDPTELYSHITKIKPDIIVPEIEAIATQVLEEFEHSGVLSVYFSLLHWYHLVSHLISPRVFHIYYSLYLNTQEYTPL